MNVVQKLKAFVALSSAFNKIKEGFKMKGWPKHLAVILAVGVNLWTSLKGFLTPEKAAYLNTILTGLYMILHTIDIKALGKDKS